MNTQRRGTVQSNPVESEAVGSLSRTLEKGLRILALFDASHPEWTLRDIREAACLPKATGFRLVKTLEKLRFLAYDPRTGVYRLGSGMLKAAYLTLSHSALVQAATPHMEALAKAICEAADLAVWTDQGSMIVHIVHAERPFRPYLPPGTVLPGLTNVHSKLFVAFGPQSLWARAIAENVPRTPYSLTDPAQLIEELSKVRREGIAFGIQEYKVGMCAVGAPVFDATGAMRASLAAVVPIERFGQKEQAEHAQAVRKAAANLSQELGYQDGRPDGLTAG